MGETKNRTLMRLGALLTLSGLSVALTLGYLGRLHPAFDSFSHFRIHLAVLMAIGVPLLLLLRFRIEAVFSTVLAIAATVQTLGLAGVAPTLSASNGADGAVYRLLHFNLRYDNPEPERALSLIGSLRPDVVTLNEVSPPWADKLSLIEAAYPYRIICPPMSYVGAAAILSRRPFEAGFEPRCGDRGSFAHVRLDIGGRKLEVATLHLGWPWPFGQQSQIERLAPMLGDIDGTAIIAGDLNSVPWSHTARQVAAAANAQMLRGIGPTWLDRRAPDWLRPLIGLPIDNVMAKGGIVPVGLRTLDTVGSDHLPVLLEFMLLPQEGPAEMLQAASEH